MDSGNLPNKIINEDSHESAVSDNTQQDLLRDMLKQLKKISLLNEIAMNEELKESDYDN